MKTLSSSREVPKKPSLDAQAAPWLLGVQFLKPEIPIHVRRASPRLGVWVLPMLQLLPLPPEKQVWEPLLWETTSALWLVF